MKRQESFNPKMKLSSFFFQLMEILRSPNLMDFSLREGMGESGRKRYHLSSVALLHIVGFTSKNQLNMHNQKRFKKNNSLNCVGN